MCEIIVYLSGPMSGTKEESTGWRNEIKEYLRVRKDKEISNRVDVMRVAKMGNPNYAFSPYYLTEGIVDFNVLDPCNRWFDDKKFLAENSSWVVKIDKMEIAKANVLIVNANENAWGTPMEQIKAWDTGKFVIAFCDKEFPSIWAKEHCHVMVKDHLEAAEWLYNHAIDIWRTL